MELKYLEGTEGNYPSELLGVMVLNKESRGNKIGTSPSLSLNELCLTRSWTKAYCSPWKFPSNTTVPPAKKDGNSNLQLAGSSLEACGTHDTRLGISLFHSVASLLCRSVCMEPDPGLFIQREQLPAAGSHSQKGSPGRIILTQRETHTVLPRCFCFLG